MGDRRESATRLLGPLLAVIVALTLLRTVLAAKLGLVDDEAYYRMWSLAPSLSFLDHPPMVAWFIGAGRMLAGDTPLGVRLTTIVASLVGLAATWRTARLLFSPEIAERTLWLMLAMPLLAVGGILITPDIPSVLFIALTLWALAELDRSQNPNWWLAAGVFCGLGLLSKYTNLFVGVTILAWVLIVPGNRRWLRSWQLWAGGALAAILTLPVALWNAQHGWASFTKQFGRVGRGHEVGIAHIGELLGGLAALANPVIFVLGAFGFWQLVLAMIKTRSSSATLIIASIVPMLAYFTVHALHDRVQANWLGPIYPSLALCAVIGIGYLASAAAQRRAFIAALVTGFVMIAAIYTHAAAPLSTQLRSNDPTNQMRGWPAFATAVDALRKDKGARWIATSSYATTAQLAFALKDTGVEVVQLNERLRYAHLPQPSTELLSSPGLYVELKRRERPELLSSVFGSVAPLVDIARGAEGAPVAAYATYVVADPKGPVLQP